MHFSILIIVFAATNRTIKPDYNDRKYLYDCKDDMKCINSKFKKEAKKRHSMTNRIGATIVGFQE